mmetsp:Transcript_21695/g.67948  ORF Transcript_21695/g.67948 Transcript_21695/m.67948 type:complete len:242 (-) Transcript_21695:336-1061(-)
MTSWRLPRARSSSSASYRTSPSPMSAAPALASSWSLTRGKADTTRPSFPRTSPSASSPSPQICCGTAVRMPRAGRCCRWPARSGPWRTRSLLSGSACSTSTGTSKGLTLSSERCSTFCFATSTTAAARATGSSCRTSTSTRPTTVTCLRSRQSSCRSSWTLSRGWSSSCASPSTARRPTARSLSSTPAGWRRRRTCRPSPSTMPRRTWKGRGAAASSSSTTSRTRTRAGGRRTARAPSAAW